MKILALLFVPLIFASGCVGDAGAGGDGAGGEIKYRGIDGNVKTLDASGKTFQQVCAETFGTWMTNEDGMSEMRNGKTTGNPCSGCMTDGSNMFCSQGDYLSAIKIR
ncbi:MAG: hypothetical protein HY517_01140 [Candidatus Aenigmarchaeota archaeon]|nr:hypothetical protein [Candidatus Aenigmarchaeota archaeon]